MKCGAIGFRGFRVSVSRKVSWWFVQSCQMLRSVQMLWARQMLRSVQMLWARQMLRSVERSLVESSKIKNSTYFPKRVLSKIKKQIQLNIFYISSHAGRFTKSSHTDRRYSVSNFFFSSIRI